MVLCNVSSVPDIEINKRKDLKNNLTPAPERRGLCRRCLVSSFAGLRLLFSAGVGAGNLFGGLVLGDGDSIHHFFCKVRTKGFVLPSVMLMETKSSSRGLRQGESGGRALLYLGDAWFGPAMGCGVPEETRARKARPGLSCCSLAERGAVAECRVLVWDRLWSACVGHK